MSKKSKVAIGLALATMWGFIFFVSISVITTL
jgi:hypothetical protein